MSESKKFAWVGEPPEPCTQTSFCVAGIMCIYIYIYMYAKGWKAHYSCMNMNLLSLQYQLELWKQRLVVEAMAVRKKPAMDDKAGS